VLRHGRRPISRLAAFSGRYDVYTDIAHDPDPLVPCPMDLAQTILYMVPEGRCVT
jgi:hypothetical protein